MWKTGKPKSYRKIKRTKREFQSVISRREEEGEGIILEMDSSEWRKTDGPGVIIYRASSLLTRICARNIINSALPSIQLVLKCKPPLREFGGHL